MAKIGRSFDELDKKIKTVSKSIRDADNQVKSLDKNIKLDPSNIDNVRQKYQLLTNNLKTASERVELLKQKQKQLKTDFDAGNITTKTYNTQLAKTAQALEKAEEKTKALNVQLKLQNDEIRKAQFSKLTEGLTKAEAKAKTASLAILGTVTAISALMAKSISLGDELADQASKYDTSVENIQLWRNRLALCASDTEAYESSLASVGSMMTSITAGRGARYLTYLENLGIAQEDLAHKTNADVFNMIYSALRNVTDEIDRSTIAQGLFGDKGLEIALIAGMESEKLQELDQALIENGIITSEQASYADEAANQMQRLQTQFQMSSMELTVALMPAFEALVVLLQTAVIPVINSVAKFIGNMTEGEQKAMLGILALLIVLPKLISALKGVVTVTQMMTAAKSAQAVATAAQAKAQVALNVATAPYLPIILAIGVALTAVISLISAFTKKAKEATNESSNLMNELDDLESKYNNLGLNLETETKSTYDVNNHKTSTIDVNVSATGDGTSIDNENAERVATALEGQIITDLINQGFGAIVK